MEGALKQGNEGALKQGGGAFARLFRGPGERLFGSRFAAPDLPARDSRGGRVQIDRDLMAEQLQVRAPPTATCVLAWGANRGCVALVMPCRSAHPPHHHIPPMPRMITPPRCHDDHAMVMVCMGQTPSSRTGAARLQIRRPVCASVGNA